MGRKLWPLELRTSKSFLRRKSSSNDIHLLIGGKDGKVCNNAGKIEVFDKHFCYIFSQLLV